MALELNGALLVPPTMHVLDPPWEEGQQFNVSDDPDRSLFLYLLSFSFFLSFFFFLSLPNTVHSLGIPHTHCCTPIRAGYFHSLQKDGIARVDSARLYWKSI